MLAKKAEPFRFKQFSIQQDRCSMKVGTDGVLLGSWANLSTDELILDIGTGSGLVAIILAQRSSGSIIHGIEIDEESCDQASENMQESPWADRLQSIHSSIQDFSKTAGSTYDLIVCNPPFFSGGTFSRDQERSLVRHTVKLPHGDLLGSVRTLLAPDGRFCVILPLIEGLRFKELALTYNLYCTKLTEVRSKPEKPVERLLMQFERKAIDEKTEQLVIMEPDKRWTSAYKALTGDLYLKM